jgi:hypothetical protein
MSMSVRFMSSLRRPISEKLATLTAWLLPPCRALGSEQVIAPCMGWLYHPAAQFWSGIEILGNRDHIESIIFETKLILWFWTGLLDERNYNFKLLVMRYVRKLQIGLPGTIWASGSPDIATWADLGEFDQRPSDNECYMKSSTRTQRSKNQTSAEKNLCRQAAGQQWPNDVVLRPHRKIPGTSPRDRLCHRRGQRAAGDVSMTFPRAFFRCWCVWWLMILLQPNKKRREPFIFNKKYWETEKKILCYAHSIWQFTCAYYRSADKHQAFGCRTRAWWCCTGGG